LPAGRIFSTELSAPKTAHGTDITHKKIKLITTERITKVLLIDTFLFREK
jgi:hypothetical protein